jgi:thiol-disulfide isomerase/thioredoxin
MFFSSSVEAQEFFNGTDIDYWKEGLKPMAKPLYTSEKDLEASLSPTPNPSPVPTLLPTLLPSGSLIRQRDSLPFSWKDYESPSSDVFWDDGGDYVPPRPFRVVAAEPSPTNVRHYLRWIETKDGVVRKLGVAINGYKGGAETHVVSANLPVEKKEAKNLPKVDWRKLDVVYFYQSSCSHCRASLPVVAELQAKGARLVPVQMDWRSNTPIISGSAQYDSELAKEYPVASTPTWVFSYEGKKIQRQGTLSLGEIQQLLL